MSPTPINYLHVKYIAPLLRLASEIVSKEERRIGCAIRRRVWAPHLGFMHWQEQ